LSRRDDRLWAGSDESGKGDYFGPLVVAAFVCDKDIQTRLNKYGVKDSKLLDEETLLRIAEKVLLEFHGNYQYFVLLPEKYNELYPKFSVKKPGLNEMLAWMHSKVIGDLHSRHRFQKVIIDKFANEKLIKSFVNKTCDVELEIITRAESYKAVATASIIARYLYLKNLKELSNKYGIKLLKGASLKVQELRRGIDKEILPFMCKMHFK
jgi:ribonuclease HIII